MLVGDTYTLINYVSFINYLCYGVTILGLLVLRWRRPALHRPIKVRPGRGHARSSQSFTQFGHQHQVILPHALGALTYSVLLTTPRGGYSEYPPVYRQENEAKTLAHGCTRFHGPTLKQKALN